MKKTINKQKFVQDFMDIRPDNFTRRGLETMYDYFKKYEEDIGTEIEFDVIAICCEFHEDDYESLADGYGVDLENIKEYLYDNTVVIEITEDTCIIQVF